MRRRVRAYIGLGANVGDARRTLTDAVAALAALPGARLRGVSRLYLTKPVGVTDQPDFLNAVVALDVPLGPDPATGATNLLVALKGLERDVRPPEAPALGPARARPRPAALRPPPAGHRTAAGRRPAVRGDRSGRGRAPPRGAPPGDRGPPVRPRAPRRSRTPPRAAGLVRNRSLGGARRRRAVEGRDAARPIGAWSEADGRGSGQRVARSSSIVPFRRMLTRPPASTRHLPRPRIAGSRHPSRTALAEGRASGGRSWRIRRVDRSSRATPDGSSGS